MPAPFAEASPVLVGQSPKIREILRLIRKLGRSDSPVLILGETGTGKEVVARLLHMVNPRGPFVVIDCSSLVGPLIESELFGHAKGAFTGAAMAKTGLLEAAHGGTAFFDEIGELPLEMQVKLLRVLQEKELRPVGSLARRRVDFRIIAATNRDLAREVEHNHFRRDLYYRLNVVSLKLPPLRERREDIPLLVEHFLNRYGPHYQISAEASQALLGYAWPGNVRELENCIQRMVAVNSGPYLHTRDLPTAIQAHLRSGEAGQPLRFAAAFASAGDPQVAVRETGAPRGSPALNLREREKEAILEALQYTKNDRVLAAQLLGIGRTTLYRKIKEYGIRV